MDRARRRVIALAALGVTTMVLAGVRGGAAGAQAPSATTAPPTTAPTVGSGPDSIPDSVPDSGSVDDSTPEASTTSGPTTVPGSLPPTVVLPSLPAIEQPDAHSARLVPVPAGCTAPAPEQAVFLGVLVVRDVATARFRVRAVRSGSITGFAVDGLIDVRYGDDVRFLDPGSEYLVGAGLRAGILVSRIRAAAPLFSDPVNASSGDGDTPCPVIADPVRTLNADGTSVDSGVLTPLRGARRDVIRAVGAPVLVAFLVLAGLAALKLMVFAVGRGLRDLGRRGERPSRQRRRLEQLVGLELDDDVGPVDTDVEAADAEPVSGPRR